MPVILVDGIVTRYANYRENDRILSIFTIDHGRLDAKSRGCRRANSPLLPASQPFVFGQFELYSGKERLTVNQCEIKESFFSLREDYERFAFGSAALQLAHNAAPENQPNEPLFFLLYHALSFLCYGDCAPLDLLCCYLIRFLNVVGYRPSITSCAQCGRDIRGDAKLYFSCEKGGAVCSACAMQARPISKLSLEALRRMLLLGDNEMGKVKLTPALREELFPLLTAYTKQILDYGAKSLDVVDGMKL